MKRAALIASLALAALPVRPAAAQDRDGARDQVLAELAAVIGESHALRQACRGTGDQFWRGRMQRLLDNEHAPQDQEIDLKEAFNAGYRRAQVRYPRCDDDRRAARGAAAARGRALAAELGRTTTHAAAVANDATPR